MSEEGEYWEPQVFLYPMFDGKGEILVAVNLPTRKQLIDVDLSFLKQVIRHWIKNNRRPKRKNENQYNSRVPTLVFPLVPNQSYEGKAVLCRALNGGKLSLIDKWLVKKAFIFGDTKKKGKTDILSIENSLSILNEAVIKGIRELNTAQFESAFSEYKDFHLLLLELGEIEIDGQKLNYASIEGKFWGWSGKLHTDWARNYRNIYEESIAALDKQNSFFRSCCYAALHLVGGILRLASMTGLDSILQMQGVLWFELNDWWQAKVEQQGNKEHNNDTPVILLPPDAKIYNEAVKFFIEGWESTQRTLISSTDEPNISWQQLGQLFSAYDIHLKQVLFIIVRSILTGNRYAARLLTEVLMRWEGNVSLSLHDDGNDYLLVSGHKAIKTGANLLTVTWEQVKSTLQIGSKFPFTESEATVFKAILKNYWQDVNILLSCFLINWSLTSTSPNPLSKEILHKLLKGILDDKASNHGKTIFISNIGEYIISFLRQHIVHRWNKGAYSALLSELYNNIDNLTKPEWVSGRIYSSWGEPIENQRLPHIILALLLPDANAGLSQMTKVNISLLLEDENIAEHLQNELGKFIEETKKLNIEKIAVTFADFVVPQTPQKIVPDITSSEAAVDHVKQAQQMHESPTEHFRKKAQGIEKLFSDLRQSVLDYRATRIKKLPISKEKLYKIAEEASAEAFDKSKAKFPVSLFEMVELTTEKLNERKLINNNFPKGALIEPEMDHTHFGEDWHSGTISPYVYGYLVFDIFEASKLGKAFKNIHITTPQEYVDLITNTANEIRGQGLTPIIVVENFQLPQWIREWSYARWDNTIKIPNDLNIEEKENRQQGDYLFHLNGTPVYEGRALLGGTLVTSQENLKKVRFHQFDNGYPVQISFEESDADPWHGAIIYTWEREVVLGNMATYFITYPESQDEAKQPYSAS